MKNNEKKTKPKMSPSLARERDSVDLGVFEFWEDAAGEEMGPY